MNRDKWAVVAGVLVAVGVACLVIWLMPEPPPPPPPIEFKAPSIEKVGEYTGEKMTRFFRGFGRGVKDEIKKGPEKEVEKPVKKTAE